MTESDVDCSRREKIQVGWGDELERAREFE
jgi:hypothetical protein